MAFRVKSDRAAEFQIEALSIHGSWRAGSDCYFLRDVFPRDKESVAEFILEMALTSHSDDGGGSRGQRFI
jgi:hypothetical protein